MESLVNFLEKELSALDHLIVSILEEAKVPLAQEVATHLIMAGGKRLRPMITFLCAHLCNASDWGRVVRLGACVELIHTATLLHDDVIDAGVQRRGKPSAHILWGNEVSILVGDFLLSRSFELMVEDGALDVLSIISQTTRQIAKGELLQLSLKGTIPLGLESYLEIIKAKTASLFGAAAALGSVSSGATEEKKVLLQTMGRNLGILFQIKDDLADFSLDGVASDKPFGNDLAEGKATLPFLLAHQRANAQQKRILEEALLDCEVFEYNFQKVQEILHDQDVISLVAEFSLPFYQESISVLERFEDSPAKNFLLKVLGSIFSGS